VNAELFSTVAQGVAVLLLAAGVVSLFQMNARLARIETWMMDHEKKDQAREDKTDAEIGRLRDRLDRFLDRTGSVEP